MKQMEIAMTKNIPVKDLGKMYYDIVFPDVNRVEVIDKEGRSYTNMTVTEAALMLQDDNKTLKIFLK